MTNTSETGEGTIQSKPKAKVPDSRMEAKFMKLQDQLNKALEANGRLKAAARDGEVAVAKLEEERKNAKSLEDANRSIAGKLNDASAKAKKAAADLSFQKSETRDRNQTIKDLTNDIERLKEKLREMTEQAQEMKEEIEKLRSIKRASGPDIDVPSETEEVSATGEADECESS